MLLDLLLILPPTLHLEAVETFLIHLDLSRKPSGSLSDDNVVSGVLSRFQELALVSMNGLHSFLHLPRAGQSSNRSLVERVNVCWPSVTETAEYLYDKARAQGLGGRSIIYFYLEIAKKIIDAMGLSNASGLWNEKTPTLLLKAYVWEEGEDEGTFAAIASCGFVLSLCSNRIPRCLDIILRTGQV